MPIGVQLQVGHFAREYRGTLISPSHDSAHGHEDFVVFNHIEFEIGDIHQDEASSQIIGEPTPTLHIQFDLAHSLLDRHIERLQSPGPDDTIDFEAMSFLEPPNPPFQGFIEEIVIPFR